MMAVIWRRLCVSMRNCDLLVLTWTWLRRVTRESISSELLLCGGGVRSILSLPLGDRCFNQCV